MGQQFFGIKLFLGQSIYGGQNCLGQRNLGASLPDWSLCAIGKRGPPSKIKLWRITSDPIAHCWKPCLLSLHPQMIFPREWPTIFNFTTNIIWYPNEDKLQQDCHTFILATETDIGILKWVWDRERESEWFPILNTPFGAKNTPILRSNVSKKSLSETYDVWH